MFKIKKFFIIFLLLLLLLNYSFCFANNSTIIDEYNNVDLSYAFTVSNGNDFLICRKADHSFYEMFIIPSNSTPVILRENYFAFFDINNNKLTFDYCTIPLQGNSAVFGVISHSRWTDNGITDNENGRLYFLFYC